MDGVLFDTQQINENINKVMELVNKGNDCDNCNKLLKIGNIIKTTWLVDVHRLCNLLNVPDGDVTYRLTEAIKIVENKNE